MGKTQKAVNGYVSVLSVSQLTFHFSLWIFDFFFLNQFKIFMYVHFHAKQKEIRGSSKGSQHNAEH